MTEEVDDYEDDDDGPRCVNCGQPTPAQFIERIDDMYMGMCDWCVAG